MMLNTQRNLPRNLPRNPMHNPQRRFQNGPATNRRNRVQRLKRIQRWKVASAGKAHKIYVFQPKNSFILRMEVPGVEAKNITIRESNGEIEIKADTYQDVTYIDPSKANFADLTSRLQDGVLLIRIPRKVPKVFRIPVEASSPPPPEEDDSGFRVFLDLPGVSLDHLTVKVREDKFLVSVRPRRVAPERRRIANRRKSWTIPPFIDPLQAKAYFHSGVLTLMAPRRPEEEEAIPSGGVRSFSATPATSDDENDKFTTQLEEDEFSSDEENEEDEPDMAG